MSVFNTMIRISCISFIALIAILKNFIPLNAISNKDFLSLTIATHENDALQRYKDSARAFNIPFEILGLGLEWKGGDIKSSPGGGQKVRILRQALEKYKDNDKMILMFTDSYDVVFQNSSSILLDRFHKSGARVLFSAEGFCWPDKSLANSYPEVGKFEKRYLNSGGFIGYANELYKIANLHPIENEDDDQLYYTNIFLNSTLRNTFQMKLDTKNQIFQNLNGALDEMVLQYEGKFGYLKNVFANSDPIVIHANGPVKDQLNDWSNHVGLNWNPEHGCQQCNNNKLNLTMLPESEYPSVSLALMIDQPTPFIKEYFSKIANLAYPREKINLFVFCPIKSHEKDCAQFVEGQKSHYPSVEMITIEFPSESDLRNEALLKSQQAKTDFVFVVDSIVHLTNANTLSDLIGMNRSFISPMVLRREKLWSNFWGALSSSGYYARSADYLDIAQYNKVGIWNVPFVNSVYLMKSQLLPLLIGAYGNKDMNADYSADMVFCSKIRSENIFMVIDNQHVYGYQTVPDDYPTTHLYNDLWTIFSNPKDWQEKYIHEDYWVKASNVSKLADVEQPCPDVFWFPLVSERFCIEMIKEMETFGQWSDGSNKDSRLEGGYENVPTRDIHMRQVDWEEHWQQVLRSFIYPMQRILFAGYEDIPSARMNFVVRYRPDEQPTLRPHHDASSYSLNIALNLPGKDFQGGGTRFNRYNCEVLDSRLGWVLMHPGRITHLHEGLRTTNGTRYIFVTFVNP